MWIKILAGAGLFLLGHYIGKQVERDAPTRDWLDKRRAEREQKAAISAENHKLPCTTEEKHEQVQQPPSEST
jgi:hypothetical protein